VICGECDTGFMKNTLTQQCEKCNCNNDGCHFYMNDKDSECRMTLKCNNSEHKPYCPSDNIGFGGDNVCGYLKEHLGSCSIAPCKEANGCRRMVDGDGDCVFETETEI
jgi:hypothetical protein